MKQMLHIKALVVKENISEQNGVIDAVVGSTSVLDRMGDIIDQSGWDLKDFKSNPVILWGHNVKEEKPPIGKALKVWVENKGKKNAQLMFKVQFDLLDTFAAEIFRKIKDGFLNTVSVGFLPLEWEELDPDNWFGGLKYLKQQLLELSFVPVPANPQALVSLRSLAKDNKNFTPVEEKELYSQPSKEDLAKMLHKDLSEPIGKDQVIKPLENEHACRLKNPDDFQDDSFRSQNRNHEGKEYRVIMGRLQGKDTMTDQSYRYNKETWSESEASSHCGSHDGTFEPAKKENKPVKTKEDNGMSDYLDMMGTHISSMSTLHKKMKDDASKSEKEVMEGDIKKMKDHSDGVGAICGDMMGMMGGKASPSASMNLSTGPSHSVTQPESVIKLASIIASINKTGRVLSAENEGKIRQAVELLDKVLAQLEKEEIKPEGDKPKEPEKPTVSASAESVNKGVIPYKDLGILPESEGWDGPGEVSKAEVDDLKAMCTWFNSEEADNKGSYKLPHHKAEGYKAVWRGVAAAMAALLGARGGVDIPDLDKRGIYNHLVKHYKQFDKEAPDFKMVEDQVLAGFEEEIQALTLDREEKHVVRLIKRVLDNQKEEKKNGATDSNVVKALEIIHLALSKVDLKKKEVNQ